METCRTCAKCDFENENNWLDLFHPTRWADEIAHVRLELSNWKLKITPNDGLPQKICTDCFSKFRDVYTFRIECQEAQVKLSHIFDKIEEQSMESEEAAVALEEECAELLESIAEAQAHDDDTLMKIFEINSEDHLTESMRGNGSIIEEIATTITTTTTTTTTAAIIPPTTYNKNNNNNNNTAYNESLNQVMTTQQHLDAIQKDLHSTMSTEEEDNEDDDEELEQEAGNENEETEETNLNDLIEMDENDVEIEAFQTITIDNIIEMDDVTTEAIADNCDDVGGDDAISELSITFECKYCFKSKETPSTHYATQQLLLTHITSTHDAKFPFTCPHCEQGFRDAASRTVHIKDKHVQKHHACDVCGKKYADRSNLRHHIEKYHSENDFECTLCEKRFYSRKSLKYHMNWHDPERQLKCNYCDRLFINQRHLKCHEATHTGLRNCEYCTFCGKSFIHLKTLRWHIYRKHGGEKPYKCSSCPEAFASYREKRIHMLEFHLENLTSIEKSECMLCHTNFEDENELKRHMSEDHKPKKAALIINDNKRVLQNKRKKSFSGIFQCDVCSQRFNMKSALERHLNVHSVEGRPHACPQCPKRFKRIQDMNWHMKTHSNDKSNICDVCGKGFALKYVLTQHKRSHEVLEKNFKCSTCGRAYLFEKTLRVHERVHTGKTYYKCDLCSESFVTHIKFKYHMLKKHSPNENGELPLDELVNIVIP